MVFLILYYIYRYCMEEKELKIKMKMGIIFFKYLHLIIIYTYQIRFTTLVWFRVERHERETKQQNYEHAVVHEVQHHVEVINHVEDESDGPKSNHAPPKLDLKNFHTQLW